MSFAPTFFDTSAWYEYFSFDNEEKYEAVAAIVDSEEYRIFTSDFVIDELMSLMRCRGWWRRTSKAWKYLSDPLVVTRLSLSRSDVDETYRIFEKFNDKQWSFTDCSSYMLIKRYAMPNACSFDNHFREFGIVTVLP